MRSTLAASIGALAVMAAAAPQPSGQKHGIAIPITKRPGLVNADGSVNLDALKASVASTKAKILVGFEAFQKNTGSPHPSDSQGIERRNGGVPLIDTFNQLWYGPITVGTPPKNFTVDFDTGSRNVSIIQHDLFLPGYNCDSTCNGHALYDPRASSTSSDTGKTFQLQYGDGSTVSGEQYTDTVTLSGSVAKNQRLGAATTYSPGFQSRQFPADGLMGMGYASLSHYGASPVFQTLVSQGQVSTPAFSFYLAESDSELYIGGTNDHRYTGDFSYMPVTIQSHWHGHMDGIRVNGQTVISDRQCIIDTGTTLIIGDTQSVTSLYDRIPGSRRVSSSTWTIPCSFNTPVGITFSGREFTISPSTFNLGPVSPGSPTCIGGFGASDGFDFWIIGDVFLRNVYTTFDLGNNRVGFASPARPGP